MRRSLLVCLMCAACSDAPQDELELALHGRGAEVSEYELDTDFEVSLSRAELAFGPLYLCPGAQAGELCDTARMEWLESAVVDALAPSSQRLGTLVGVTGSTRSWMFDYGISSLLTKTEPVVLEAAEKLGGASLVLEGQFVVAGTSVPFEARVRIEQQEETERGIPVMRKSTSDTFFHSLSGSDTALTVGWDPVTWLSNLRAEDVCPEGTCPEEISWDPESRVSVEIGQAMVAGERPTFVFE